MVLETKDFSSPSPSRMGSTCLEYKVITSPAILYLSHSILVYVWCSPPALGGPVLSVLLKGELLFIFVAQYSSPSLSRVIRNDSRGLIF